ncbi:unnamed protein product [Prunus armeniaca]|uniref:Cyclic nucleotide-binding domain-containing protein n=1 Tax=Prunus armeniaca TaxID=36596 RepID=A0A6J5X3I7_PRUAR|nr:hypothetical protein GBA52_012450 [Prunus armeniaca]CAB4306977.1 unnamed protein product [Prunus armeniaca]
MSSQRREDDDHQTNMASDTQGKPYNLENVEGQARRSAVSNKNGELSTKKKWESKLLSASCWNKMIVISCVIAISLDPLFLYIPFIDEDNKCLGMDKKLRNVALISRSLTDITFLVDIGYQIIPGINKAYEVINQGKEQWELDWQSTLIRREEIIPFAVILARELNWCSLVTDLLSVFPMPQLLVGYLFFEMRRSGYLERRKVVNFFLLSQYLPRIYRIVLSSKELTRTAGIRVKALFNLFLYILASHVIGAFWYFFSVQRETSCWHRTCGKQTKCMSTFYCDDDHKTTTTMIKLLNTSCGIPDDNPQFDYGIFLDSIKIGNTGHIQFPTKLCYSFWWGLRNLSNFGTSLTTSSYVWENLFAILISVTGLLLFIYLIGNVQTFIQMRTTKSEEIRQKIDLKKDVIETWMNKNDIPDGMKKEIMKNINKKWEEDKDGVLENIFNVLPDYTKKSLKYELCLKILSQEPLLQLMDDKVRKMMCDYLKPVTYKADDIIFQMDHPINRMLLIIEGTVLTYKHTRGEETTKDSGDVYGQELLTWSSNQSGSHSRPICSENVQCRTNVEGFVLLAEDLVEVSKCERWKLNDDP